MTISAMQPRLVQVDRTTWLNPNNITKFVSESDYHGGRYDCVYLNDGTGREERFDIEPSYQNDVHNALNICC